MTIVQLCSYCHHDNFGLIWLIGNGDAVNGNQNVSTQKCVFSFYSVQITRLTILEEYVMIRQLLKWLNGRDSSLHFKYLMIFGKPNSYFHQRFILQVRFSAVKAQPNNYVRSHESACHGHLLCMFGKINGTCVEIETSF